MAGRMNLKPGSAERAILAALIVGVVLISPMGSRIVWALAKYYLRKWWEKGGPYVPAEKDPEQVRSSLYKLKRNEYIEWKYNEKKNIIKLELTKKGRKVFQDQQISELKIIPKGKWDGRWRFVLFDIPERMKSLRESFRKHLKDMGFFRFQKSVWIHPYECENELTYLAEFLGIKPFVIIYTATIDNDVILRKYFLDQGVLLREHRRNKPKLP